MGPRLNLVPTSGHGSKTAKKEPSVLAMFQKSAIIYMSLCWFSHYSGMTHGY